MKCPYFKFKKKISVNTMRFIFFILCCMCKSVYFQTTPNNPCPNIFKYLNTNGIVHGRVEFENDQSGSYRLSVNMSVAAYLGNDQNIQLRLLTPTNTIANGGSLVYNVYFPSRNVIPKPTQIVFNNRMYCFSPPELLEPGGYVTNLWATTFLKITTTHAQPPINEVLEPELPFFPPLSYTESPVTHTPPFTTPKQRPTDYNECGASSFRVRPLIVRGDEVNEGQYPWMVAVMYKVGNEYQYRCTGTLVSNRHVITAGHCLQYGQVRLFVLDDLMVVLGITNLKDWASTGVLSSVEDFKTHPDYKENAADCDVTIITLSNAVQFRDTIRRACLWEESEDLDAIVSLEGIVAGWGSNTLEGEFSNDASSIKLPIVSQTVCLKSDPKYASITSARTFCAGRRNNRGICTGDSGAGFLMLRSGRWTLRGVTSIALKDSCDLENFAIFADIAKIINWIKKMIV